MHKYRLRLSNKTALNESMGISSTLFKRGEWKTFDKTQSDLDVFVGDLLDYSGSDRDLISKNVPIEKGFIENLLDLSKVIEGYRTPPSTDDKPKRVRTTPSKPKQTPTKKTKVNEVDLDLEEEGKK